MQGELSETGSASRACGRDARGLRGWRLALALLCVFIATPAVAVAGALFDSGSAYLASTAAVIVAIVPFLASFERRRPQACELVLVAVLCAIAVASRVALFWLPFFKPIVAVVMIAGMALGAPTGFLVGALSALVSDFFFGQGLWTPWQMLAFGISGFAFGLLADAGIVARDGLIGPRRLITAIGAAAFVVLVSGPILDTSTLFLMSSEVTFEWALAVYAAGLPGNAIQASCVFLTMLLAADPLLERLARVRAKHGLME